MCCHKRYRGQTAFGTEDGFENTGSSALDFDGKLDAVSFSGGVAEAIYEKKADAFEFGDIGIILGQAVKKSSLTKKFSLILSKEMIRATVIGAGTYTTTISGSNNYLYRPSVPELKIFP